jgi:hypothetical protein
MIIAKLQISAAMTSGSYKKHPHNTYLRHTITTQKVLSISLDCWTYQKVHCRLLGHTKTVLFCLARVHAATFMYASPFPMRMSSSK